MTCCKAQDCCFLVANLCPWCWERLRAGGEGGNRGWDGWMASPTQWAWVWANSGRWWRTGRPGVLQSVGPQRVGHDLVTEQQQSCIWLFCDPVGCDPAGSSVHGILHARILELAAFPSPGDLPNTRIKALSPALAGASLSLGHHGCPYSSGSYIQCLIRTCNGKESVYIICLSVVCL